MTPPMTDPLQMLTDEFAYWFEIIIRKIPAFIIAFGSLALIFILSRYLKKGIYYITYKLSDSKTISQLTSFIAFLLLMAFNFLLFFEIVGLHQTILSLLAGAGIFGLTFSIGFQDIAHNIMSGFILSFKKPFKLGDLVEVCDVLGYPREVHLIYTLIENRDGQMVAIPNRILLQNKLINYFTTGVMRIKIGFHISYGENVQKVADVLKKSVLELEICKKDFGVNVFARSFDEFAIEMSLRFWVDMPRARSEFRKPGHIGVAIIQKTLAENGIRIPYPIRTVDFEIQSGRSLADELIEARK